MEAVEYLKQLKRMCKGKKCNECPLYKKIYAFRPCVPYAIEDEKMTVEIVEKWAKGHPVKTRAGEFLKMFPNVTTVYGYPAICPRHFGEKIDCGSIQYGCIDCRKKYWSEEIE